MEQDKIAPKVKEIRVTLHRNTGNYCWEEIGLTLDLNDGDLNQTIQLAKKRIISNLSEEGLG